MSLKLDVKKEGTCTNKEELETLNESCGILNVLCDILLSPDPIDSTRPPQLRPDIWGETLEVKK
jgi:hypothetical protein